jgi:putative endonuclease
MIFYVYAIRSLSRNYIYVGMTNNIERRIKEHNQGENKSTKAYKPFVLIYSDVQPDGISARTKEKFLKSGIGKEFLRSLC